MQPEIIIIIIIILGLFVLSLFKGGEGEGKKRGIRDVVWGRCFSVNLSC